MDDEELIRRIQAGERELLAELPGRFIGPLFDFFRRNRVGEHDAEDLVQETLLQCMASLGAFRGKCAFRTWLFRMAKNRVIDRARRPRQERLAEGSEDDLVAPPGGRLRVDRVREAIPRLIPARREVVRLVHEEDLTTAEAAARLGKSEQAVRKELSRAYADLRVLLAAGEEEDAEE